MRGVSFDELVELSRRAIVGPPPEKMSEDAIEALNRLQKADRPTEEQVAALEYAIRLFRPAPLVKDTTVAPLPSESAAAFPGWDEFGAKVKPFLRSIGRVDRVTPDGRKVAIGTGFLIAPNLLVTNRHVVWQLSNGGDVVRSKEAVVYFRFDWDTDPEPPVAVRRVAAFDTKLDIAILEVELAASDRTPLRLSTKPPHVGGTVVVVGFPWDDGRTPAFAQLLFGGRYGVKRAAPGEVLGCRTTSFLHDCTTLAANSGSPVLSMETAEVVGIHADGIYLYRNEAIMAISADEFLQHAVQNKGD